MPACQAAWVEQWRHTLYTWYEKYSEVLSTKCIGVACDPMSEEHVGVHFSPWLSFNNFYADPVKALHFAILV